MTWYIPAPGGIAHRMTEAVPKIISKYNAARTKPDSVCVDGWLTTGETFDKLVRAGIPVKQVRLKRM